MSRKFNPFRSVIRLLSALWRVVRARFPNPVKFTILWIGLLLARFGFIDRARAEKTTELAWPRVLTGIARMSKNAVDVAMVGVAVGTSAVAGVGFASPYWGLAFAVGGGVAGGTIALVSQRYGAEAFDELGLAVRASVLLVLIATIPLAAIFGPSRNSLSACSPTANLPSSTGRFTCRSWVLGYRLPRLTSLAAAFSSVRMIRIRRCKSGPVGLLRTSS